MSANTRPVQLSLDDTGSLVISWSDDKTRVYPVQLLRDHCPCATCREQRKKPASDELLPVLAMEETVPLKIAAMSPVGSYAYSIEFSDGHNNGIYTLEHLLELGVNEG